MFLSLTWPPCQPPSPFIGKIPPIWRTLSFSSEGGNEAMIVRATVKMVIIRINILLLNLSLFISFFYFSFRIFKIIPMTHPMNAILRSALFSYPSFSLYTSPILNSIKGTLFSPLPKNSPLTFFPAWECVHSKRSILQINRRTTSCEHSIIIIGKGSLSNSRPILLSVLKCFSSKTEASRELSYWFHPGTRARIVVGIKEVALKNARTYPLLHYTDR